MPGWIDAQPVTNRQFQEFVNATRHITFAEIPPDPDDYPGTLPHMLFAGSLAFTPPKRPVDLRDWSRWWTFMKGAGWRRPYGPESNIKGLDDHPVVYVAYSDALAYATRAEKIYQQRPSGSSQRAAALGRRICLRAMANTWQGEFPIQKNSPPGLEHTSPVRA